MYIHRNLENIDLETICTFPQNEEELYYISPRFTYPLTPDQILNLLQDRHEPTVVLNKHTNEVVAYANIYGNDPVERTCWLGNVIVSPGYRGTGAAPFLIGVMLDKAKNSMGSQTLRLACHSTNSRGLAFYAKQGFKPFGVRITKTEEKSMITIHMVKGLI
ncbi:GNAT family N-acetyltransferase [Paenibacillus sp. FSL W8-0426]|uniref:GNAT family N-acetyltransferase n=1 Tax=Paenibacillus sp. FSL W8-0426 TaxID=2921714 RepID=UPI0030DBF38F